MLTESLLRACILNGPIDVFNIHFISLTVLHFVAMRFVIVLINEHDDDDDDDDDDWLQ